MGGLDSGSGRQAAGLFPNLGNSGFWIFAAVVFAVFTRPLISGMTYPWSNTYFQIILAAVFTVYILKAINGEELFYSSPIFLPAAAMLLWTGVSSFFSVNPGASVREFYNLFGYILLMVMAVNLCRGKEKRDAVLAALIYSSAVVSLYAVYQYFWGLEKTRAMVELYHAGEFVPEFMTRLGTQRAFSTFVYPPALAGFLTLVTPPAISAALSAASLRKKLFLSFVVMLNLFALVLTYSKGGWIVMAASVFFFFFLWINYIKKKNTGLFFALSGAGAALLLIIVLSGVESRATASGFAASYRVRYEYWKAAPGMIRDYPVFGSGPGTWGSVYPRYKLLEAEETRMAHNNFVQEASEKGPPGLLSFVWLLSAVFASGFRVLKSGEGDLKEKLMQCGVLSAVFAFSFQSLGEFTLYIPGVAANFFLMAGIIGAAGGPPAHPVALNRNRKIACGVIVLSLSVLFMLAARKPMAADRHFDNALEKARTGDVFGAEALLSDAVRAFPLEARYYYYLGMLYESRPGFMDSAIEMYESAAARNPEAGAVNSRLAQAYWSKSRGEDNRFRDAAVRYMERAVGTYPFSSLYRIDLGRMYHLSGRTEEALAEYRKAVEYEAGERMTLKRDELEERLGRVRRWIEEIESER